ncbi:phage tail tube protein [Halobellus rubicundus]|uniref:Phage tail tube protein n=1 Tax=Halobellus rubicundus TaxID=2996466 RepID=A0ABD5MEL4_9EURY
MTGAGSATVAFGLEDGFGGSVIDTGSDGNPDYFLPFKNPSVEELSLDNALQRERDPGDVEPDGSLAQNFEGGINITGELAEPPKWHDLVFNDGGTGFIPGRMPSAKFFFGIDYLDGTAEWTAEQAITTDATINWQQGQPPTVDWTLIYGNASSGTSITPSNIQKPALGDMYAFHGLDLTIDGASVSKLQSASLSIPTNARFHRDDTRHPADAVIGAVNPTLSVQAIISGVSNLEAALGGSTPVSMLSEVSGSMAFTSGNGDTVTYNLGGMKPANYSWDQLINTDGDAQDPTEFHVSSLGVA